MKLLYTLLFSLLSLSACQLSKKPSLAYLPIQAIEKTAKTAPNSVSGIFELTIKATNSKQRLEFLHSEADSQDQRNLIIAIRPNAVRELTDFYGQTPRDFFLNKKIRVKGEAKRQKIWVLYKNKNTQEYYYQTKIFIKSADQITLLN